MSATHLHSAKAVGWNEMPFGKDTHVVPSNTVLDGPRSSTGRDIGVRTPSLQGTKSLWPLLK